jgi:hypothetical protein
MVERGEQAPDDLDARAPVAHDEAVLAALLHAALRRELGMDEGHGLGGRLVLQSHHVDGEGIAALGAGGAGQRHGQDGRARPRPEAAGRGGLGGETAQAWAT